ncbi:MAG: uroporphyrinogen-III synthase [Alistipes indistinctus]
MIFTSRTTIDSFFRICEEARIAVPESMKYFCNTEAVALYLQKYIVYRKRKIFFADGAFANFMELLNKHKEEKYLLTVSEPHKPEMPLAMEKLRLTFDKVVLARTVSADLSGINVNDYDMLVFYSPSEIRIARRHLPGHQRSPENRHFRTRHDQYCHWRGTDRQRYGAFARSAFDDPGHRTVPQKDQRRRNGRSGSARRTIAGPGLHPGAGGQTR